MKLVESYIENEATQSQEDARTIQDFIRQWNRTRPDENAFVFLFTDGKRAVVTWKEFYENCTEYAKAFINVGVKEKDVVAFTVRSQQIWLYIHFGLIFAGAIPAPVVFTYKDGSDVIAILNRLATCTAFILDPEDSETTWPIFKSLLVSYTKDGSISSDKVPSLKYMVCMSAPAGETEVLILDRILSSSKTTTDLVLPVADPSSIAALLQTSGSTGIPKMVAHTHNSLAVIFGNAFPRAIFHDNRPIYYNDRPFNWIGGWPTNVLSGETRVCLSGLSEDPKDPIDFTIEAIQQECCTTLLCLPPRLHSIMERLKTTPEGWPLKTVLTGGQPLSQETSACLGVLCDVLVCLYGCTELLFVTSLAIHSAEDFIAHTCGSLFQGLKMKIVDDDGNNVPVNERGEVLIKSPGSFDCYFNDPERTGSVLSVDGWFKTDDVGRMNEDGLLFVEGRKSEMILSGGFNVPPSDLEEVIRSCPGINMVMVVPIPDDLYFQLVCACVILDEGSDLGEEDLKTFCLDVYNDKKQKFSIMPSFYLFYVSFPQTRTGKTSRKLLTADAISRIKPITN